MKFASSSLSHIYKPPLQFGHSSSVKSFNMYSEFKSSVGNEIIMLFSMSKPASAMLFKRFSDVINLTYNLKIQESHADHGLKIS